MFRNLVIASNWKAGIDDYSIALQWLKDVNIFLKDKEDLLRSKILRSKILRSKILRSKIRVPVALPYCFLGVLNCEFFREFSLREFSLLEVFSQNVSHVDKGAYTGEVTVRMLKTLGVRGSIVGHSERRHIFGEDDELINRKVSILLENEMDVIFCIGEKLEERNSGRTQQTLYNQISKGLKGVNNFDRLIVAYEPVWAIGTGVPMGIKDLQEAENFIREVFKKEYKVENLCLLYGGSVNKDFIKDIRDNSGMDGVLVGSASWTSDGFIKIIENFIF
ncbi:MAG: triose-phosphate isomerase [bacterium]